MMATTSPQKDKIQSSEHDGKTEGRKPLAWKLYSDLTPHKKNQFCLDVLRNALSDQRLLLYGWAIQQLYSQYATDFLPEKKELTSSNWVLEII